MVFKLKNTFLVPVSPLKTACFLKTPILNNYLWLVFESVQYFSHFMLFGFYNYFFSFPCFGVTSKCHILLVTKWFFVILWNIDLHTGCLISEPFFTTWSKITFEIRLWNIRRHLIVKTAKTSVILFCQPTFCWCFYFYDYIRAMFVAQFAMPTVIHQTVQLNFERLLGCLESLWESEDMKEKLRVVNN